MSKTTVKAATVADVNQEPDVVLEIVEWLEEEPRKTAMQSKGDPKTGRLPEAKYQRSAKVRNRDTGKVGVVPVVGTARQWQYASGAFVEGYLSSDKTKLYCQPHLDRAEVEASDLI